MRLSPATAALLLLPATACVARPRMCSGPTECGTEAACVAGRCQRNDAVAALQSARRVLVQPSAVAYIRRGEGATGGALPALLTLGRAAEGEARLLLRFSIPATPNIIEAYVLLERSDAVDIDPSPIALHAARIVDPWDARSVSWARGPAIEETRSPFTTVAPTAGSLVRVDVRDLVQRWRARDVHDQGIAIVAEGSTPVGVAFAPAPRLELYVK
jgi:hypothetical protein